MGRMMVPVAGRIWSMVRMAVPVGCFTGAAVVTIAEL
jgi:hypothetical protein